MIGWVSFSYFVGLLYLFLIEFSEFLLVLRKCMIGKDVMLY